MKERSERIEKGNFQKSMRISVDSDYATLLKDSLQVHRLLLYSPAYLKARKQRSQSLVILFYGLYREKEDMLEKR